MARRTRRLLIAAAILIVLLLGAVLALPFLIDADRYRETVRAAAEEAMGRPVGLGRLHLRILPRISLAAENLSLGATPAEGGGHLLTAASVRIGAELMPLLQGRLEVTQVVIVEPELRLRRGADGTWVLPLPVADPSAGAGGGGEGGGAPDLNVGLVALRRGRVVVETADGARTLLEDLDLELVDVALDRPLSFAAGCTWVRPGQANRRMDLEGTIGWQEAGDRLTVRLEPTVLHTGGSRMSLAGRVEARPSATDVALEVTGADLAAVDLDDILTLAGVSLPGTLPEESVRGEATLKWSGGRAVLAPLEVKALGGQLRGEAVLKPEVTPPQFQLSAELSDIRSADLLQTVLGMRALSGRLGGKVEVRGHGGTYEELVRGARGGGRLEVVEGHLNGLDVLASVSRASGVFGEDTVQRLSQQLASEGMDFSLLSGEFALENGRLVSPDLLLKTEDLKLAGSGAVDLISGRMNGTFRLVLSSALSESMRGEGSRAARLFWNAEEERVILPLKLSGPVSAPEAGIDWGAAASSYLESEIRRNPDADLGGALRRLLGEDDKPKQPAPQAAAPPAAGASPDDDPGGAVTRAKWGGPLLAPDLKLEGWVAATRLQSASIRVEDARGRVVESREDVPEVAAWRRDAGDTEARSEVRWSWKADGKRFLVAEFPVQIIVTVRTADGRQAEIRHTVNR